MNEIKETFEDFVDKQSGKFEVKDNSSADWCIRKIAKCESKIIEIQKFVAEEKAKLDTYLMTMVEEQENRKASFEMLLRPYAEKQLEGSKLRSIKLPNGTVGFRKAQPSVERDDTKLLQFAKSSLPEFVKVKESVDWSGMKKELILSGDTYVTKDGEVVDGVKVTPAGPDNFYVKAGGL